MKLDASQEEALLRSSEAEAELARQDLERSRGLASEKVVSRLNSTPLNRNSMAKRRGRSDALDYSGRRRWSPLLMASSAFAR